MESGFLTTVYLDMVNSYINLFFGIFGLPILTVLGIVTLRSQHRKNKLTIEQLESAKGREQQNRKSL